MGKLQVAAQGPRPKDIKLQVRVEPDAPLGFAEVQLGQGQGSRGKGKRPLDDAVYYAGTLRRVAAHINAYADSYECAAREDAEVG